MKTLLVDFAGIAYPAIYSNDLYTTSGLYTGGVYGVMRSVLISVLRNKVDRAVVLRDFPPYLRKNVFPDYKASRPEKPKDLEEKSFDTGRSCREIFRKINVPLIEVQGYEADDLIAKLVYQEPDQDFVILSGDSDLWQLLRPGVHQERGSKYWDVKWFKEEHGIEPEEWALVTAIMGSHNDVPGINGLGPKKSTKMVKENNFDTLSEEDKELVRRNLTLVCLPYVGLPKIKPEWNPQEFDSRELFNWFYSNFEINLTEPMLEALEILMEAK